MANTRLATSTKLSSLGLSSSVVITSAQTAATGTNWTAFASQACDILVLSNNTGTAIEFRRGAAGTGFQLPDKAIYQITGISNANEIGIRRVDTSNTQVTATAEAISV